MASLAKGLPFTETEVGIAEVLEGLGGVLEAGAVAGIAFKANEIENDIRRLIDEDEKKDEGNPNPPHLGGVDIPPIGGRGLSDENSRRVRNAFARLRPSAGRGVPYGVNSFLIEFLIHMGAQPDVARDVKQWIKENIPDLFRQASRIVSQTRRRVLATNAQATLQDLVDALFSSGLANQMRVDAKIIHQIVIGNDNWNAGQHRDAGEAIPDPGDANANERDAPDAKANERDEVLAPVDAGHPSSSSNEREITDEHEPALPADQFPEDFDPDASDDNAIMDEFRRWAEINIPNESSDSEIEQKVNDFAQLLTEEEQGYYNEHRPDIANSIRAMLRNLRAGVPSINLRNLFHRVRASPRFQGAVGGGLLIGALTEIIRRARGREQGGDDPVPPLPPTKPEEDEPVPKDKECCCVCPEDKKIDEDGNVKDDDENVNEPIPVQPIIPDAEHEPSFVEIAPQIYNLSSTAFSQPVNREIFFKQNLKQTYDTSFNHRNLMNEALRYSEPMWYPIDTDKLKEDVQVSISLSELMKLKLDNEKLESTRKKEKSRKLQSAMPKAPYEEGKVSVEALNKYLSRCCRN